MSIFGPDIIINGNVISEGTVDICGKLNGNIISKSIFVKNGGFIEGKIYANELSISENGNVNGKIVANKINILKNATICGDIMYESISIEDGAKIFGKYENNTKEKIEEIINAEKNNINSKK